jgi:hypothetical protein
MKVAVNGRELELPAATGTFDWLLPMPAATSTSTTATSVSVIFTVTTKLPGGDERPTGGKLELLEVLPALPTSTFDFGTPGAVRLAATGVDQDGWIARSATLELPASPTATDVAMRFEYPDWSGKKSAALHAQLADGSAATTQTLAPGEYTTFRVRVPASAAPRTLRLDTPEDFSLPAPDTRRRAARLLQVDLAAVP